MGETCTSKIYIEQRKHVIGILKLLNIINIFIYLIYKSSSFTEMNKSSGLCCRVLVNVNILIIFLITVYDLARIIGVYIRFFRIGTAMLIRKQYSYIFESSAYSGSGAYSSSDA